MALGEVVDVRLIFEIFVGTGSDGSGSGAGPITDEGKLRCAKAKTIHGKDTRADRQVHRLAMKRLRLYAQILGVPFRSDAGDKRL